jgi:hypothetical protein
MKYLKRISQIILVILIIRFIFQGWVYRQVVTYKSIGKRVNYSITNKNLIKHIEENNINIKDPKIEEIRL